jgi:hypothetical protein
MCIRHDVFVMCIRVQIGVTWPVGDRCDVAGLANGVAVVVIGVPSEVLFGCWSPAYNGR